MDILTQFLNHNKHIYITGPSSSGKTTLINNIKGYNKIYIKLKNLDISNFLKDVNNANIVDSFNKIKKYKLVIIDDIDILSNTEKKIINELVKHIKNIIKLNIQLNYKFVFLGINNNDKKIKELMNITNVIKLFNNYNNIYDIIQDIICKNKQIKNFNYINDKAIKSLLLHENIINNLKENNLEFYYNFLSNYCNGDYYDRISFQKQIWLYNEITFYLKFIINIILYNQENVIITNHTIRFTKILTKYSNEYNNNNYINIICNNLNITNKELYNLFLEKSKKLNNKEHTRLLKIY
jgi:hypothetical protein